FCVWKYKEDSGLTSGMKKRLCDRRGQRIFKKSLNRSLDFGSKVRSQRQFRKNEQVHALSSCVLHQLHHAAHRQFFSRRTWTELRRGNRKRASHNTPPVLSAITAKRWQTSTE